VTTPESPQVWLGGPIPEIPPLLQPVAHALLQAEEEVRRIVAPALGRPPLGASHAAEHTQRRVGQIVTTARIQVR